MSASSNRPLVTRRNLIILVIAELVLFVIANVTANSAGHPGAVSQIAWWAFLIGVAGLIVIGVARLLARRAAR